MSTTRSITTAAELLAAGDVGRCELVQGQLHMMTPAGFEHGRIIADLTGALAPHVRSHDLGVVVGAETGFIIERDPDTVRAPDVAFVSHDRLARSLGAEHEAGYFPGAPNLAVEVLSPHDRMSDVLHKVEQWLAAGCETVWIVDPKSQTISVYRPDGDAKVYNRDQTLDADAVVRGFALSLANLFR